MARGILFSAGLKVLIAVLGLVLEFSSADDSRHHCAPSSCGNIRNISYPFRLESDPEDCGNQRYNLTCENNHSVLYLHSRKYYVLEINYTEYAIRVVESSIQERNGSFISAYSLVQPNFTSNDSYTAGYPSNVLVSCPHYGPWIGDLYDPYRLPEPYEEWLLHVYDSFAAFGVPVVLVNCEKPAISGGYWDTSACFDNGVYFSNSSASHSKMYQYLLLAPTSENLEELCQVEQISWRPWRGHFPSTCTDFYDQVAQGFKLSWVKALCKNFTISDDCALEDPNAHDLCQRHGYGDLFFVKSGFSTTLYRKVADITRKLQVWKAGIDELRLNGTAALVVGVGLQLLLAMVHVGLSLQATKTVLGAPFVVAFLIYKWYRRHLSAYDVIEEFLHSHNNLMPVRYSYSDIKKITKGFKDKLGEGGYGTVFKGTLRSGCLVAVKVLDKSKANGQDFISEVATIGRIHHVNVVQLIGFSVEGLKQALVYEFMPNGSLNTYIFSPEVNTLLSYDKIFDIALGVARGIEYLHQGCEMQILHFDIKPHNILLDENLNPKVSDFGLAKLYAINDIIVSLTAARGTLGYMAPELFYKNIGGVSYKADVYSFGMLLMEMAGKRKNLNAFADHSSQIYFPTWVYDHLYVGKDIEMEDDVEKDKKIFRKMITIALWCIQMKPSDRPSMKEVVQMFEGDVEQLQIPPKPFLADATWNLNKTHSSIQSDECSESA